jgi:phosphopantothenoylcysteine decarboxylase/phosphopantothenate--cysteine ligase
MSKYKILFKITGSIAAYKAAYLISKLVQNNFEVQTVVSESALHFIGKATLEGLSGKAVLSDTYENGKMMNHINLVKWADLVILCPASANTINKLANGIADNLITSLFLAHDWNKPYLIAPAMNSNMYHHPITKKSLGVLESLGVKILPTDSGYLACGDIGDGKLLEPEKIYNYILMSLLNKKPKRGKILITAGATKEYIDGVRYISNISTGKTASTIAKILYENNYDISFLHGTYSEVPDCDFTEYIYDDFESLKKQLYSLIEINKFDFIIHSSAVSDYTIDKIETEGSSFIADKNAKINSELNSLTLKLKPTEKLLNQIKRKSLNKEVVLVAFKFVEQIDSQDPFIQVEKLFHSAQADLVVLNSLIDRKTDNTQRNFYLFDKDKMIAKNESSEKLALTLNKCFQERIKNVTVS